MPLDTTIVSSHHLFLFGVSLTALYATLAIIINRPAPPLRQARPGIYYAGALLLTLITLLAFATLDSVALKLSLAIAALITLIVGIADESAPLTPGIQFIWQLIIVVLVTSWGWTITHVTNPIAPGVIDLTTLTIGPIALSGTILTIVWLLLIMNAINWLDGSDGLAVGISFIAFITLGLISLLPQINDSRTLSLALIGAGATLGFLLWNFPPAKVYLGTTGSWFLGLYLGAVAILGGGKIVTTLLILALPVVDLLSVSLQRLAAGRAPWQRDTTRHLHFRLRTRGVPPAPIAIAGMIITTLLGIIAITAQTNFKIVTLAITASMVILITLALAWRHGRSALTSTPPAKPAGSLPEKE